MRREEGRNGEEQSRAEVEAVGVFVCPRRLLSSHYQGIRQMLLLYRCWFNSEPPTLIPSSPLLPTTPRQRLLYTLSPPLHVSLRPIQSFVKKNKKKIKIFTKTSEIQLFNSCLSVMHMHSVSNKLETHICFQNYLVHSQSKFVSSLIFPDM